jgi:hypothetical protein
VRCSAGASASYDLCPVVVIDVTCRNEDSACEGGVISEEAQDLGVCDTVKYSNMRCGARASTGDYVVPSISVNVGRCNVHAAAKSLVIREESANLGSRESIEDLDVWCSTRPRGGDDIVSAVSGDVSCRNRYPTLKSREGIEVEQGNDRSVENGAVDNFNVRSSSGSGTDNKILQLITVEVAAGDRYASSEVRVIGEEAC